ncbi:MAG: DUF2867 domain-containing protein [Sneathiella sp.]|nr:DUF2867 domain-containing protein [Sneathiella sp.]
MADASKVPKLSLLAPGYGQASYQDCFSQKIALTNNDAPVTLFTKMMQPAPKWVKALMSVRNWVVGFFGLKATSSINTSVQKVPSDLSVGDYVGFFKITNLTENEIVVTANDNHLDASFSLFIEEVGDHKTAYMISIVQTKRRFGDVYMWVIAPFHRLIVRHSLRRLG